MTEIRRTFEIINEKGMHARASAKFVQIVEQHEASAEVFKNGMSAFGDSIMGLLMLSASKGTSIEVRITGEDAKDLAEALEELISNRFWEGI